MRFLAFLLALVLVSLLTVSSLVVGSNSIGIMQLLADPAAWDLLILSRIPRTVALLLCGMAMSVCGLIMQMLTQNRYVEPATAGAVQSAGLGILIITILWPAAPVLARMGFASFFSLLGTGLFLLILQRLSLRATLIVPLVGIMLGAVISAVTVFIAVRFDLLQSLAAWTSGDFSGVMKGRYELLWLVGALTLLTYFVADRFAVAGMGREFAVNLGLNYRRVMLLGMSIVAIVSGVVVVVIGALPFLGLIVPNIVSLILGDNVRRNIPWIALLGGGIVVACDLTGRLLVHPFEIPAGSILGVIGAVVFLFVILREQIYVRS
ncbi:iron chelate uptake ABC transporter family permease subunit [Chromatiaceae bacterium AAb-1]|nr:iron chelate uptake ABC transporter family permease subunit [Chromatiaceae bacterium AAb-1]